jgi:uncharacterized surface protein with fasciclin (FAS1) repeats
MKARNGKKLVTSFALVGLINVGIVLTILVPAFARKSNVDFLQQKLVVPNTEVTPSLKSLIAQNKQIDIVDTAIADGSLNTLVGLLTKLGMAEDLRGYGRFTVFAPTDDAFAAVPTDIMKILSKDRKLMARVLAYHVVASRQPLLADNLKSTSIRTLERSDIKISKDGDDVFVNGAKVIKPNIKASNGVIHEIDRVLIPADVMAEIHQRMQ